MNRTKSRTGLVAAVLLPLTALLVGATAPTSSLAEIAHLPAPVAKTVADAGALAAEVRAATDRGVAATVDELVRTQDLVPGAVFGALPDVPAPPRGAPAALAPVVTGDVRVDAALADLAATVAWADDVLGRVDAAELVGELRGYADWLRDAEVALQPTTADGLDGAVPELAFDRPPAQLLRRAGLARVAAAELGAAVDRALPALRNYAVATPATGETVEGCDLLAQLPLLCVGSEADNVYTQPVSLIVDLGGDDVYDNAAAAAPFGATEADDQLVAVSLVIDSAGDDVYAAAPAPFPSYGYQQISGGATGAAGFRLTYGQAVGIVGAVGMLVDDQGDDTYTALAPPNAAGADFDFTLAQGVGLLGGIGVLVDYTGEDDYRVVGADDETVEDRQTVVYGQGVGADRYAAFGGGLGALVDAAAADDHYLVDGGRLARPAELPEGFERPLADPILVTRGQGMGNVGVGILKVDGWDDTFRLRAAAAWPGRRDYSLGAVMLRTQGQGAGSAGVGVLLSNVGGNTFEVVEEKRGMAYGFPLVQGAAVEGVGVLDDLGGDDLYTIDSSLDLEAPVTVDDGCRTPWGEQCAAADVTVDARYLTGGIAVPGAPSSEVASLVTNTVIGQGAAWVGQGVLHDYAGSDRYEVRMHNTAHVELTDGLSAPEAAPRLRVNSYTSPWVHVQGAAVTFGGAHVDEEFGTDTYTVEVRNDVDAAVVATGHDGDPDVRTVVEPRGTVLAQGASNNTPGTSALVDTGGDGDRLLVDVDSHGSAEPGGTVAQWGGWWPWAQAEGGGHLYVGATDPYLRVSPSKPVCAPSDPGARGFGTWVTCARYTHDTRFGVDSPVGRGDGNVQWADWPSVGYVPEAAGARPELTLSSPESVVLTTASAGRQTFDVSASLADADGQPLAGRRADFYLQFKEVSELGTDAWHNLWWAPAVTGSDGTATGSLPVEYVVDYLSYAGEEIAWRVLVTFDGEPGLYPVTVTNALSFDAG